MASSPCVIVLADDENTDRFWVVYLLPFIPFESPNRTFTAIAITIVLLWPSLQR